MSLSLERLHRLGLGDHGAAVLAGTPRVVVPEIQHGLAEVVNDIGAIEVDIFDKGAAIVAIKNDVLVLAGGSATLDDNANRIGWTDWRVRDVRWNEEGLALADEV